MYKNKPFIHLFRTMYGFYFYDVNKNLIIKISEETYEFLENYDQNVNTHEISKMKANGFLSTHHISKQRHPHDEFLKEYLETKIEKITLQITQECNFRCEYCMYSGSYNNREHSDKKMSFDIAKKAIDFLVKHSGNCEKVNIGFYGGEPLLEIEMIKKCIEYIEENLEGKEISYSLTTNATLINDEIIEFFCKHNISLLISLDGPQYIHDQHRKFASNNKGTFNSVIKKIGYISSKYPRYFSKYVDFNAVLDPERSFSCISEFFTNYEIFKDSQNINSSFISSFYAKDYKKQDIKFTSEYNYEIFKVMLWKLGRLNKSHVSKLLISHFAKMEENLIKKRFMTEKLPDIWHHGGPCVPGVNRLFIDVNGNLFPCERVSENSAIMNIGNLDTGFNVENCRNLLNIGKITEEQCNNCWSIRQCSLCAATADDNGKLSKEKKLTYCNMSKLNVENMFKDLCTLIEHGCKFEDSFNLFKYQEELEAKS